MTRKSNPGAAGTATGAEASQSGRMAQSNSTNIPNVEKALALAAIGVPVFPCNPVTKRPYVEHGFHAATTDVRQIAAWWRQWPSATIGVPTGAPSGVWVADADIDKATGAKVGVATLAGFGLADHPYRVTTPSGGEHLFFRYAVGLPRLSVKHLPGVDIRGDGGYVIAYDFSILIAAARAPDLSGPPAALLAALETRRVKKNRSPRPKIRSPELYAEVALAEEAAKVREAAEGTRNDTLNRAAFSIGQIVEAGALDKERAAGVLRKAAVETGLSEDEVARTIASAFTAAEVSPRDIGDGSWKQNGAGKTGETGKTEWPAPDGRLLRPQRNSPPALPSNLLSPAWQTWVETSAQAKGAPTDYVVGTLFSVASSLIGNSRSSSPWDGWTEPPVLWTLIIGSPSTNKSPAMDAVLEPLRELERQVRTARQANSDGGNDDAQAC